MGSGLYMKTWLSQTNPFSTVMRSQVFTVWMWRLKTLLDTTKPPFTFRSQVSEIFRFEQGWTGWPLHQISEQNDSYYLYNTVSFIRIIINNHSDFSMDAHYLQSCAHTLYAVSSQDRLEKNWNTFFFLSAQFVCFLQLLYRMSIWRWSQSLEEIKK